MTKKKHSPDVFGFKPNRYIPSEVRAVGAQKIGEAILESSDASGIVDKKRLVEQARPKSAPLHPCFEWDDDVAGQLWREQQARNIVNVLTVEVAERQATAFPSLSLPVVQGDDENQPPHHENIYIPHVLGDAELRQQRANQALAKLIRVRREYQDVNELQVAWDAIQQLEASAAGKS